MRPRDLASSAFARFGAADGRRIGVHSHHGRGVQAGHERLSRQDRGFARPHVCQSVLRELDPHADQLLAGRPALGADTVDFSSSGSSLSKGETFIDTAKNIEAMGVDVVVVRHRTPGTPQLLAQNLALLGRSTPATARTSIRRKACSTSCRSASAAAASRPDRGAGRRHRPQPHGPLEHLGPEEARAHT